LKQQPPKYETEKESGGNRGKYDSGLPVSFALLFRITVRHRNVGLDSGMCATAPSRASHYFTVGGVSNE
jgi:hypothetical protein